MSLSDLASLGSFVSGAAVLVSLVFLYVQMRHLGAQIAQAERNQQAAIRAERASRTINVMTAFVEPAAAEAVFEGNAASEALTPTQISQYTLFCISRFTNAEDAFSQNAAGLLEEDAMLNLIGALRTAFGAPGFRAAWQLGRGQFHGDFVAFMDKLLNETPVSTTDAVARWRTALAAERANVLAGAQ